MVSNNWQDSAADLRKFLGALIDAEVIEDTEEVKDFLEKPQRYNDIYEAWAENDYPQEDDDTWDNFVESVSSEEAEEEEEDA